MKNYQCKICGNTQGNQVVIAKEMMFGFRDEFTYFKCSSCGCLQITEYPKDLSKYYPGESYYSYKMITAPDSKKKKLKIFLKYIFFNFYWHLNLPLQSLPNVISRGYGGSLRFLRNVTKTSAILDVGCGNGYLLQQMSIWGFKNLTGIDPFIEKDILYPQGICIWKTDIYNYLSTNSAINKRVNEFDVIMLHHSFEHMDNPREVLSQLHKLLKPGRQLLIRIPVSDSFAWRKYGVNWFQLDVLAISFCTQQKAWRS
jgi:SAM-dependent methyltransferase